VPGDSGSGLRFVAGSCVFHPLGDVAPVLEWAGLNVYVFAFGKGIGNGIG